MNEIEGTGRYAKRKLSHMPWRLPNLPHRATMIVKEEGETVSADFWVYWYLGSVSSMDLTNRKLDEGVLVPTVSKM